MFICLKEIVSGYLKYLFNQNLYEAEQYYIIKVFTKEK